jgi:hypothetical protein
MLKSDETTIMSTGRGPTRLSGRGRSFSNVCDRVGSAPVPPARHSLTSVQAFGPGHSAR